MVEQYIGSDALNALIALLPDEEDDKVFTNASFAALLVADADK